MKICLTGGIACGKSLLVTYLNRLGIETLDADDVVHELLPDPAERKRIAAEVFSDPEKRRALEARLHPLVRSRIEEFLNGPPPIPASIPPPIRIAVIPLLFETHWDEDYDIIASIVSSRDRQIERMVTNRGYSREEAEARLAAQMPVSDKASQSDYVIHNDGTPEELEEKARQFVEWLKEELGMKN